MLCPSSPSLLLTQPSAIASIRSPNSRIHVGASVQLLYRQKRAIAGIRQNECDTAGMWQLLV